MSEFSEFVRFLEDGGLFANPHWAPQVSLVPRTRPLDFVGRVENLPNDLEVIVTRIWPDVAYSGVSDWRPHRTDAALQCDELYNSSMLDRVERLYTEDFLRFRYSPRSFA